MRMSTIKLRSIYLHSPVENHTIQGVKILIKCTSVRTWTFRECGQHIFKSTSLNNTYYYREEWKQIWTRVLSTHTTSISLTLNLTLGLEVHDPTHALNVTNWSKRLRHWKQLVMSKVWKQKRTKEGFTTPKPTMVMSCSQTKPKKQTGIAENCHLKS